jgi:hypothetical protein
MRKQILRHYRPYFKICSRCGDEPDLCQETQEMPQRPDEAEEQDAGGL